MKQLGSAISFGTIYGLNTIFLILNKQDSLKHLIKKNINDNFVNTSSTFFNYKRIL